MERYTLSKRVGMRAEAKVRAEFLRARFSQIGSGKNGYGSIWKTAFSRYGKQKYFPRLFGHRPRRFFYKRLRNSLFDATTKIPDFA